MGTADPKKLFVLLIGLLGITADLSADGGPGDGIQEWVQFDPWEGELFSEFDGTWRSGDSESKDIEFENGIRLRKSGFALDPKIATFSLETDLRDSRGTFEDPVQEDDRDGLLLGYNASLSLLHGTPSPVSMSAHTARTDSTTTGSLGSRTDSDAETRSVALNFKTRVFPASLSYSENLLDQTFRSRLSAATSERDDSLRSLKFNGRSSKMTVFMERSWFDDRIAIEDRDYLSDTARLSHRFRWGKASHLNTELDYFDRGGFRPYDRLGVAETAHIQHTENLSSSTSYRYSSLGQERDTERHSGTFGLTHHLYRNLTTSFSLFGTSTDDEVSEVTEYGTALDLDYRKGIVWGGKLSASVGIGYRITDRRSDGGLLEVFDERHVVDPSLVVVLDQRFIETASIIVTDATGTFVFAEGVDYTVVPAAEGLTEIHVIAGGPIGVGDTILVSYRFESLPTQKFSTLPFHYSVALDFGWVSLFHRLTGSNQDLISGGDEDILTDRRNSATGIEFRWARAGTRATFTAEMRFTRSGDFESESFALSQSLSHRLSPTASLSLTADENSRESGGRRLESYRADLSANWRPWRNLSIRPHTGVFLRREPEISDERFIAWGLDLRWRERKLEIALRYDHTVTRGTVNENDEDRLMLTLVRRI